jgi:hypothetical protein
LERVRVHSPKCLLMSHQKHVSYDYFETLLVVCTHQTYSKHSGLTLRWKVPTQTRYFVKLRNFSPRVLVEVKLHGR